MSSPTIPADTSTSDAPPPDPNVDTADVDMDLADGSATQANPTTTTNGVPSSSNPDQDMAESAPPQPSSQQNRKDATLREFMSKMDDYAPIIPDAVIAHYLTLAGLSPPHPADPTGAATNSTPLPLARLLGLATQKFIADIAADAYQYSRIRAGGSSAATANALGNAAMGAAPGATGPGGAAGGGGGGGSKGAQNTQLGVQRSGFGGGGAGGSGKAVLTMEDLGMAVQEYGVNVKRGEFYR